MSLLASHARHPRTPSAALQAGVLLGACLVAVALGFIVPRYPELLHVNVDWSIANAAWVVVLMALCVGLVSRPTLALILLVAFVFLNLSQLLVRFYSLPSTLQFMVLPLAAAAWLHGNRSLGRSLFINPLALALVGYAAVLFVSTTFARDLPIADERVLDSVKALILYGLLVALIACRERLRQACWVVVVAAGFLAGLGLWQIASGSYDLQFAGLARVKYAHIYGSHFEPRIAGPVGDPNFFAQILLMALPVGLYLFHGTRDWRGRGVAVAATALTAGGIAFTYSRGAALALFVILVLWALDRKLDWRHLLSCGAFLLLLVTILPSDMTKRITTLQQVLPGDHEVLRPDSSLAKRKLLALGAWEIYQQHPVLGVGGGNFTVHFEESADEVGFAAREYADADQRHYTHNLYLEIAAETGTVGLAAFALVLFCSFAAVNDARRRWRAAGDDAMAGLSHGLQISLVGYLVSSMFLHGHHLRYLWLLFALITATWLLAALANPISSSRNEQGALP